MIAAGALATYVFSTWSKRMEDFAKENPALALMEGADITEYKKFEAQSKGQLRLPQSAPSADPEKPVITAIETPGPDR